LLLVIVFTGCGSPGPVKYRNDSLTSGTIHISVDESLNPKIQVQKLLQSISRRRPAFGICRLIQQG
jgi:hypothetical protein